MKRFLTILTRARGTTLLEVLTALAITGVITMAILKLYMTQHENYLVQDDVSTVQQNARASIDELTRVIRMAGYRLPFGMEAILAMNSNPDTIAVMFLTSGCETHLAEDMPLPSSELKCVSDISCFSDGQWVYIADPDAGTGEWFQITQVQASSFHLQHNTMSLSKAYGADAVVAAVTRLDFYIDNTTDPDHPKLMVRPFSKPAQVYAENIVDLQFDYRLTSGVIVPTPIFSSAIREVLIRVTARSGEPDPEHADSPYRTRTFTSSVNMRNVG